MGDVYEQNISAQNRKIFRWIIRLGASPLSIIVDVNVVALIPVKEAETDGYTP